jgi:hypothetical protein
MDTQQVERDVVAVLHRRAEDAMSHANTQEALQTFQSVAADQPPKSRRLLVVAGVAAAVVALVVGLVLWPSDPLADDVLPAVETPDLTSASELAVAEDVAAAFVAHDLNLLTPHLDPDVSPSLASWAREFMRDKAWNVELRMEPCVVRESPYYMHAVQCPFSTHLLGSEEVGRGPFFDNQLSVLLKDGKVLSAETDYGWEANGIQPHYDAVMAWVEKNNPQDAEFLLTDEQAVEPNDWPRWSRLWHRSIADYIAATNKSG